MKKKEDEKKREQGEDEGEEIKTREREREREKEGIETKYIEERYKVIYTEREVQLETTR